MEKGARCSLAQKYYTRLEVAIVTNAQTYNALVLFTTVKNCSAGLRINSINWQNLLSTFKTAVIKFQKIFLVKRNATSNVGQTLHL